MAAVTLRNLGGSVVLVVPKKILSLVDLDAGATVDIRVDRDRLIIAKQRKVRYSLHQLLAQSKASDFVPKRPDRDWLDDGPAGREEL